jgi:type VI secretion system secreted protein VgrG
MDVLQSPKNLNLKITTPLGDDVFVVDQFEGREELSTPFEYVVFMHSMEPDLPYQNLLAGEATLSLQVGENIRYFTGFIGQIEQNQTLIDNQGNTVTYYKASLYPKLWLQKFNRDYRIFQNQSALTIVQSLLEEVGISDFENAVESAGGAVREYCVQYDESVFDFISRLLEEEGIYYYFEHNETTHTLVLADNMDACATPVEPSAARLISSEPSSPLLNVVTHFSLQHKVVPGQFETRDFNFTIPSTTLVSTFAGTGRGGSMNEFPSGFSTLDDGEARATYRLQECEWPGQTARGQSTLYNLQPNRILTLENHPRSDLNIDYVICSVTHKVSQRLDDTQQHVLKIYENTFTAFPRGVPFRPLRRTPKKRITSHQTAIVTGPEGEEIFVDSLGRIKVKFHWDHYNQANEDSSCWVRVAQTWSGAGWGALVTPRIGMEVVVSYIEGDPDRPLVVGCVYNGDNLPPEDVANPTRSIFRTNSSLGGDGFNELYFDDSAGAEEIYTHAQHTLNTTIEFARNELINEDNDTLTLMMGEKKEYLLGPGVQRYTYIKDGDHNVEITTGDHTLKIEEGDQTVCIDKGDKTTVLTQGDFKFHIIKGDHAIEIREGDHGFSIHAGDYEIKLGGGDLSIDVKGDIDIKATGSISLTAGEDIDIKAQNISSSADLCIDNMAGGAIGNMALLEVSNMALLEVSNMALLSVSNSALLSAEVTGMLMCETKGGLIASHKAGLMATLKGGAMASLMGGIAKIN